MSAPLEWEQADIFGNLIRQRAALGVVGRLTMVGTRLSPPQLERLRFEQRRRDCSASSIIREAVDEWLRRHGWDGT